jgi:hypothetical protein
MREVSGLNRNRYNDAEWAQIITGLCLRQTSFGMFGPASYCQAPAPNDHVYCRYHQQYMVGEIGRVPNPDGT